MNIYIANLSFDVNDADLNDLFGEYGDVSSTKVIMDKFSGKSRGFGFVEMPNSTEAKKAIGELNGVEYDGKVITVNEAKPRTDRPRNSGGNRNYGGGFNSKRY
ncbi:MAG: RNA-binding protein [Bacteroidales bacterium]|jgi:RNA recognition motif-containing protein|nr:RNA-binding protein [Bacteroidales bacterium]